MLACLSLPWASRRSMPTLVHYVCMSMCALACRCAKAENQRSAESHATVLVYTCYSFILDSHDTMYVIQSYVCMQGGLWGICSRTSHIAHSQNQLCLVSASTAGQEASGTIRQVRHLSHCTQWSVSAGSCCGACGCCCCCCCCCCCATG